MKKSSSVKQNNRSEVRPPNVFLRAFVGFITIILVCITGTFLAAKIHSRSIKTSANSPGEINISGSAKKPLFYDSVGNSNPESNSSKSQERVTKFTVNVRTLHSQGEAEQLLKELSKAGLFGFYTPVRQADKVLYYVRIGVFSDESEANQAVAILQRKSNHKGLVTKLQ